MRIIGIVLSIVFLSAFRGNASHIIGSEVTYEMIRRDATNFTIDIIVTIYRDKYQGGNIAAVDFDSDVNIAIYEKNGDIWDLDDQRNVYEVPIVKPDEIPLNLQGNQCFDESVLPMFSADKSQYILRNITLDVRSEDYRISAQRCCRSGAINNIVTPDQTGSVTEVIITPEAQSLQNDSPIFRFDPENVICVGFPQVINMEATDADGDQLVYSFTTPKVAGGVRGDVNIDPCPANDPQQFCAEDCDGLFPNVINCRPDLFDVVEYIDGFTFENPVTADQPFQIDPATGLISGSATVQGVYVIGIKVEEYRNGVRIGEITRDFNLNVTNCNQEAIIGPPGRAADIEDFKLQCNDVDQLVLDEWDPCGAALVTLQNYVQADPDKVSFRWTVFESNGTTELMRNETDWQPSFDLPIDQYIIRFTLFPDLVCEDFCDMSVNVTPPLSSDFSLSINDGSQCEEGPIHIIPPPLDPNASYMWDFGDGTSSSLHDPSQVLYANPGDYTISLDVNRGQCSTAGSSGPIAYFPLPDRVVAIPSQFEACGVSTIQFENITIPASNPYSLLWDFGDGNTSNALSPENTFIDPDTYQVSMTISSNSGCSRTEVFPWTINILPSPLASFSISPEEVTNPSQVVEFTNESVDANTFKWNFGDGSPDDFAENTSHQYSTPGTYTAELLAFSVLNNCVDTAFVTIPVTAAGKPIFPNAFIPLSGQNPEFRAVTLYNNFEDFYLAIYDRWGQLVFESTDITLGWNGTKQNAGADLPAGVYIYQYTYEVMVGSQLEQGADQGTVYLMR